MGIVFALRGDSLTARYAPGGGTPSTLGATANLPVVNSTQAGINGSTSISFNENGAQRRSLHYPTHGNLPLTGDLTVLMRLYVTDPAQNLGFFRLGLGGRTPIHGYNFYINTSNQFRFYQYSKDGSQDAIFSNLPFLTANTWHDIVVRYRGDLTALGSDIYLDGTLDKQQNPVNDMSDFSDNKNAVDLCIGYVSDSFDTSNYYVDEVVIWDEIINPASVALTSGTGSLNGASRTAYVDVSADTSSALGGGGEKEKGFTTFGN